MTLVLLLLSKELNCCCVIFWLFKILALLIEKVTVVLSSSIMVTVLADGSYLVMVPETRSGRLPAAEVLEVPALDPLLLEEVEAVELLSPQAARALVAI